MGQFLFIGLNTKITVSRKAYRGPDLSREEIEKELGSYLFDSELYNQSVTEELFVYSLKKEVAEAEWLPQYTEAIKEAKKNLASGRLIETKDYHGAARLPEKSPAEVAAERDSRKITV